MTTTYPPKNGTLMKSSTANVTTATGITKSNGNTTQIQRRSQPKNYSTITTLGCSITDTPHGRSHHISNCQTTRLPCPRISTTLESFYRQLASEKSRRYAQAFRRRPYRLRDLAIFKRGGNVRTRPYCLFLPFTLLSAYLSNPLLLSFLFSPFPSFHFLLTKRLV
jgi:hypothetical protein